MTNATYDKLTLSQVNKHVIHMERWLQGLYWFCINMTHVINDKLMYTEILERVLLKVVDLDVGVDVNVDFTTKVTHTYVAFYEGA